MTLVLLSAVAAIFMAESVVQAQTADTQSPVSLERIRAALNGPPPVLRAPAPPGGAPTFRVEVTARPFVLEPVEDKPFDPTFGLPSAGELLIDGIEKIRSARRARAERRARKHVDDALASFCAARDCATPPPSK